MSADMRPASLGDALVVPHGTILRGVKVTPAVPLAPLRAWTREQYFRHHAELEALPEPPGPSGGTAWDFIRAVGERAPWQADAACREHPEVNFFTVQGE